MKFVANRKNRSVNITGVLLCLLVLICAGASHATLAGFSSGVTSTSFGTNVGGSAFEGKDLQRVQELDQAFNMKRAPGIGMHHGRGVTFACSTSGTSSLFIGFEILFSLVAAGGCLVGIAFYLIHVLRVNASEVCSDRETLYRNHGYTWMTCDLAGEDYNKVMFSPLSVCLFLCRISQKVVDRFRRNLVERLGVSKDELIRFW
uniref:Uncharacterized protein n=1 Tax=Eptatretus burgeri TaxID=7764 RepID=A0A8C4QU99_EPTBU